MMLQERNRPISVNTAQQHGSYSQGRRLGVHKSLKEMNVSRTILSKNQESLQDVYTNGISPNLLIKNNQLANGQLSSMQAITSKTLRPTTASASVGVQPHSLGHKNMIGTMNKVGLNRAIQGSKQQSGSLSNQFRLPTTQQQEVITSLKTMADSTQQAVGPSQQLQEAGTRGQIYYQQTNNQLYAYPLQKSQSTSFAHKDGIIGLYNTDNRRNSGAMTGGTKQRRQNQTRLMTAVAKRKKNRTIIRSSGLDLEENEQIMTQEDRRDTHGLISSHEDQATMTEQNLNRNQEDPVMLGMFSNNDSVENVQSHLSAERTLNPQKHQQPLRQNDIHIANQEHQLTATKRSTETTKQLQFTSPTTYQQPVAVQSPKRDVSPKPSAYITTFKKQSSPGRSSISPKQIRGIANPFGHLEKKWDNRRPTIEQRFDLYQQLVMTRKQNDEYVNTIAEQKKQIEYQTWKNGQFLKKLDQLKTDDLTMRQDIVTYDSCFAEHGDLQSQLPDVIQQLRLGADKIKAKIQFFEPHKQNCLDELIRRYQDVAAFEAKRNKQSRVTRCILKMARRITLHVEMKAKSPAVFCETYKTKDRYEKFYNYFVMVDQDDEENTQSDNEEIEPEQFEEEQKQEQMSQGVENRFTEVFKVPRFECPFLRDED